MARVGDWKLVREFGRDWELYNMREDRTELRDLRHRNPGRADELICEFEVWAGRVGVIDWDILRRHPDMDWVKPVRPGR